MPAFQGESLMVICTVGKVLGRVPIDSVILTTSTTTEITNLELRIGPLNVLGGKFVALSFRTHGL